MRTDDEFYDAVSLAKKAERIECERFYCQLFMPAIELLADLKKEKHLNEWDVKEIETILEKIRKSGVSF